MPPRIPKGQLPGEDHRHPVALPKKPDPAAAAAKKRMQAKQKKPAERMPDWLTQPAVSLRPTPAEKLPPGPRTGMVKYSEKHKGTPIDVAGPLGKAAEFVGRAAYKGYQQTPLGQAAQVASSVAKESHRIRPQPPSAPHVLIPSDWLDAESRAASKGAPVYADEIKPGGYALGVEKRTKLIPLLRKKGQSVQDLPTWNDAEALARAFGPKFSYNVTDFIRNYTADLGEQGALVNAPSLIGSAVAQSVEERSAMPLAHLGQSFLEGYRKPAPVIGDRPWYRNAYERPITTALTVAPIVKGGLRIGPGRFIKPTRTLEVPSAIRAYEAEPTPERLDAAFPTVPATQHPIGRTGQAIHDYFLKHGTPDTEGLGPVATARAKIGNKANERLDERTMRAKHEQSRLKKGQEPYVALLEYSNAIRDVPAWQRLLPKGRKQARLIEAIVRSHAAFAAHSDQVAEAFDNYAKESDAAVVTHETTAMHLEAEIAKRQQAEALRQARHQDDALAAGDEGRPALPEDRELTRLKAELKAEHAAAEERRAVAKTQRTKAQEFREFTIDPHAPEKGHGELAEAARKAARLQTQMLKDAGFIDDKGVLYGDWQHKMALVRATEGPNSPRAIAAGTPNGTPAWHIAETIQAHGGLRDQFNALRDKIHGREHDDGTEIPASADIRSAESEHQLGRARRVNRLVQTLADVQRGARRRARERRERLPAEHAEHPHGPVAHAVARAQAADINPGVVTRAVDKATSALLSVRRAMGDRAKRIDEGAQKLEAEERKAHHEDTQDEIARLEQSIKTATIARHPQTKILELERQLRDARELQESGFTPSRRLLTMRGRAEREALRSRMHGLTDAQISEHIDKHFTPDEIEAIGRPVIEDAVRHALDEHASVPGLGDDLARVREEARAAFGEAAGHSIDDALHLDTLKARYGEALRAFDKNQRDLGYDAAHGHLHAPDTPYGLQPVTRSGGTQFREGNFTNDMHVFYASDLAGLTHKAVEGLMYQELAQGPFVLPHPVQGEPVPKGFYAIPREAWTGLERASRDSDQLAQLQTALERPGPAVVPFDGGETILISEVMRQHVIDLIKRGKPEELHWFLKATNTYRRWMLFTLPRTWVANAVGNPILASLQGKALFHWGESIYLLRKHPELIPNNLRLRGIAANIGGKRGARGLFGPQAFWRHHNTFQEDNGNLMVYLMHAKKAYKKENGLRWFNRVGWMNEHWLSFLDDLANGRNPDAAEYSAKSAEMFGEMNKSYKLDPQLSGLFMFHRWVGHMIFLTMWTMPVRYTGRTLFLQQTAILADQYRKEHGLFPDWAQEMIPLWDEVDTVLGKAQHVTWALSGSNILPQATYGQTFDLGDEAREKTLLQSAVANNVTPLVRIPAETLWLQRRLDTLQPFQNEVGQDINGIDPYVVANSVIANIPLVNTAFPRPGLADNTVQIPYLFPQNERYSKRGIGNRDMAPSRAFRDRTWWQEVILRLGSTVGGTVRPIDAAGPRTFKQAVATREYQQLEASKRKTKDAERLRLKLNSMSLEEQKAWWRANKPSLYDRKFPNG